MAGEQGNTDVDWGLEAGARLDEARACMAALTEFIADGEHSLSNKTLSALSCAAETLLEQAHAAVGKLDRVAHQRKR